MLVFFDFAPRRRLCTDRRWEEEGRSREILRLFFSLFLYFIYHRQQIYIYLCIYGEELRRRASPARLKSPSNYIRQSIYTYIHTYSYVSVIYYCMHAHISTTTYICRDKATSPHVRRAKSSVRRKH